MKTAILIGVANPSRCFSLNTLSADDFEKHRQAVAKKIFNPDIFGYRLEIDTRGFVYFSFANAVMNAWSSHYIQDFFFAPYEIGETVVGQGIMGIAKLFDTMSWCALEGGDEHHDQAAAVAIKKIQCSLEQLAFDVGRPLLDVKWTLEAFQHDSGTITDTDAMTIRLSPIYRPETKAGLAMAAYPAIGTTKKVAWSEAQYAAFYTLYACAKKLDVVITEVGMIPLDIWMEKINNDWQVGIDTEDAIWRFGLTDAIEKLRSYYQGLPLSPVTMELLELQSDELEDINEAWQCGHPEFVLLFSAFLKNHFPKNAN